MKLKQLSIPLENAPGRLHAVTQALGAAGINLRANCICDSAHDFGVLRILVSDLASARAVVMERQIPARVEDVVAVEINDTPGALSEVLGLFLDSRVNVDYMYAVAGAGAAEGKAVMIFSFSAIDEAIELLRKHGLVLLDAASFGMLESN